MKNYMGSLLVSIALIAALLFSACAQPAPIPSPKPSPTPTPTPAPTAVKPIKFSYSMPKAAAVGRGYDWFGPEFMKRTQGRYKIETYPGNTLVPITAALDSVKKGVAEIVMTATGSFPRDFAMSLVTGIPTLGFPMGSVDSYYKAADAWWEFYNTVPEIKSEFKDTVLVHLLVLDAYNLVSKKKEIHSAKDFQGMKVGGSGAKMEIVALNGGAKVQMIPPNSYESLDKGVVEAGFLTFSQVKDYKIWELCSYYYTQDFGCGQHVILMNKDAWAAIPAADQKILLDTFRDSIKESAEGSMEDVAGGKKGVVAAGYKVTDPTPAEIADWETNAQPAIDSWIKDAKALNIDTAVINKVLAAWKQIRAKYLK
jgi:TRAP-type transport system periplasmic protein